MKMNKYTNMKNPSRRVFLRNATIISIASLSANHAFAQILTPQKPSLSHGSLLARISTKTCSIEKIAFNNLFNIYNISLNNWKQSGYEAMGTNYYVCQDENLVLCPLQFHHNVVGLIDSVLLCFGKNQEGEWQSLKPLSGFDLEVLAVAAEGLQKHNPNIELSDYLLPSITQNRKDGFCFTTQKGEVFIKSILLDECSRTEIIVKEGDKILFQQTIISAHHLAA